jgi:flagellar biosynthetic protein FliS
MTRTDLAYRQTAAEGTNGFGVLIALYDTLANNLRRAAEAERANDIERRSSEVNHAILVIAYLEDWVKRGPGGELAEQLTAYYAELRRTLVQAQVNRSAKLMEEQMASVLKLRGFWQQADLRRIPAGPSILAPAPTQPSHDYPAMAAQGSHSSWSA